MVLAPCRSLIKHISEDTGYRRPLAHCLAERIGRITTTEWTAYQEHNKGTNGLALTSKFVSPCSGRNRCLNLTLLLRLRRRTLAFLILLYILLYLLPRNACRKSLLEQPMLRRAKLLLLSGQTCRLTGPSCTLSSAALLLELILNVLLCDILVMLRTAARPGEARELLVRLALLCSASSSSRARASRFALIPRLRCGGLAAAVLSVCRRRSLRLSLTERVECARYGRLQPVEQRVQGLPAEQLGRSPAIGAPALLRLPIASGCLIHIKHRPAVRAILRFHPRLACFRVNGEDEIDDFLNIVVARRL